MRLSLTGRHLDITPALRRLVSTRVGNVMNRNTGRFSTPPSRSRQVARSLSTQRARPCWTGHHGSSYSCLPTWYIPSPRGTGSAGGGKYGRSMRTPVQLPASWRRVFEILRLTSTTGVATGYTLTSSKIGQIVKAKWAAASANRPI